MFPAVQKRKMFRLPGEKASVSFNGIYRAKSGLGRWRRYKAIRFLRSSLRKSKEIKCTSGIKIEDANRNDNRNLKHCTEFILYFI